MLKKIQSTSTLKCVLKANESCSVDWDVGACGTAIFLIKCCRKNSAVVSPIVNIRQSRVAKESQHIILLAQKSIASSCSRVYQSGKVLSVLFRLPFSMESCAKKAFYEWKRENEKRENGNVGLTASYLFLFIMAHFNLIANIKLDWQG